MIHLSGLDNRPSNSHTYRGLPSLFKHGSQRWAFQLDWAHPKNVLSLGSTATMLNTFPTTDNCNTMENCKFGVCLNFMPSWCMWLNPEVICSITLTIKDGSKVVVHHVCTYIIHHVHQRCIALVDQPVMPIPFGYFLCMMPYNLEMSKLGGVKSREGTNMLRVSRESPTKIRQMDFGQQKHHQSKLFLLLHVLIFK